MSQIDFASEMMCLACGMRFGSNAGIDCNTHEGPCACGAWHDGCGGTLLKERHKKMLDHLREMALEVRAQYTAEGQKRAWIGTPPPTSLDALLTALGVP